MVPPERVLLARLVVPPELRELDPLARLVVPLELPELRELEPLARLVVPLERELLPLDVLRDRDDEPLERDDEPLDALRDRELLLRRDVPPFDGVRSSLGISLLMTSLTICGICFSMNFCIRSSWRRNSLASFTVSLSPSWSARASIAL